jgi:hypothetical protein
MLEYNNTHAQKLSSAAKKNFSVQLKHRENKLITCQILG